MALIKKLIAKKQLMSLLTTQEQKDLMDRHEKLLIAVNNMRTHQKRYFKTRSSLSLDDAKKCEKYVDSLLDKEIEVRKVEHRKIF